MANLYLLDDLKDLVGAFISKELVQKPPGGLILVFSQLAGKYSAQKIQETICDHILENFSQLAKEMLDALFLALPMLGRKAWEKLRRLSRRTVSTLPTKRLHDGPSSGQHACALQHNFCLV